LILNNFKKSTVENEFDMSWSIDISPILAIFTRFCEFCPSKSFFKNTYPQPLVEGLIILLF